jgi:signal transduction histidine kinase/CheY-like chemotaxis protein
MIAAGGAELPLLSQNADQLKSAARALMSIKDIAFVTYLDNQSNTLLHQGMVFPLKTRLSSGNNQATAFIENADVYEFIVPVVTIGSQAELMMMGGDEQQGSKELIGWMRIGISKEIMKKSEREIIARSSVFALIFSLLGVLALYQFISVATRPFSRLVDAIRRVQDGTLSEVTIVYPDSEIGILSQEYNRMISTIREREDELKQHHDHLEDLVHQRTEELEVAKEHAESANRAKSIFLANMGHELRTPLNAVLGYTQLLRKDTSLLQGQREYLNTISRSGEHLLSLINDVLEISRIEAQTMQLEKNIFDPKTLFRETYTMFSIKANEKNLQFILDGVENVPGFVVGDEGKLRQMMLNIVGNAIKFTSNGGVAIRVQVREAKPDDTRLLVEVEDTGPGIAPDEHEKVFQAFEQTASGRHTAGGTGLGMTISRNFARMMGGDLTLRSQVGKGSIFILEIPIDIASGAAVTKSVECKKVCGLVPGQLAPRVLVAEDTPESRALLVTMLSMVGFEVREAVNGEEAVAFAIEWHPHFIWMDVRMPVMDGMEATRLIKGSPWGSSIKIAALTASGMLDEHNIILSAGFDELLTKPFVEEEMFDVMARLLGVSFIYSDEEKNASTSKGETITRQRLINEVGDELLAKLRKAVTALDTENTLSIIDRIAGDAPSLGASLRGMAENFEFELLLSLVEAESDDENS